MSKRILPMFVLASLAGCQAPQATTTLLPASESDPALDYQTQQTQHEPSTGHLKQPLDRHKPTWYDKHGFVLVPDTPAAQVTQIEVKPAVPPEGWDTASFRIDSEDTPGLTQRLVLYKDATLLLAGTSYMATGSLLPDLPPGRYLWTASLWQGGQGGSLVGEDQKSFQLVDGANALKLSPEAYPSLGLIDADPLSSVPGATVSLIGQGFSVLPDQNVVTLGGLAAQVVGATSTRLTVVTPALSPGNYVWWIQVGSAMVGKAGYPITSP